MGSPPLLNESTFIQFQACLKIIPVTLFGKTDIAPNFPLYGNSLLSPMQVGIQKMLGIHGAL